MPRSRLPDSLSTPHSYLSVQAITVPLTLVQGCGHNPTLIRCQTIFFAFIPIPQFAVLYLRIANALDHLRPKTGEADRRFSADARHGPTISYPFHLDTQTISSVYSQHLQLRVRLVMDASVLRQRLRGKTGCLSCRNGRKKCDERTPTCKRCSLAGRVCEWPNSKQMLDRRYASHPESRHGKASSPGLICIQSENTARERITIDLEVVISRHFIEKYYGFLLLPNCHHAFHDGWIRDIQSLMVTDQSVRYSVLANAASHIHNMDTNPSMQSVALQYYSKSIQGLTDVLNQAKDPYLTTCNGFLMSVMLLYLHGCMGSETYLDIPPHLRAAMRVLTLRLFETPPTMLQPFECLALESVLFQMFLTSTVLWTDAAPLTDFDLSFWVKAEHLLEQSIQFPGKPNSLNSPVLGVSVSLFRLVIQAKQAFQTPGVLGGSEFERLRTEIQDWEIKLLLWQHLDPSEAKDSFERQEVYYHGTTLLYVLIISLLLEQTDQKSISDNTLRTHQSRLPAAASGQTWQIKKAVGILRAFENDSTWTSCYIGNWPVYTLGFFLNDPEDISLIRNEMSRRWTSTKFMQIARFRDDLEATWRQRGLVESTSDHAIRWSSGTP
ncbi:hypothetical protein DE146DRAFT_8670 [Phaeosphaeria sp. MPI-PUGE-AT-0046c]|nr:hypothetical protein DE146DRAFT_8670 [Phaeosphaeria sp. MPI-PUGE-AT-0046c]